MQGNEVLTTPSSPGLVFVCSPRLSATPFGVPPMSGPNATVQEFSPSENIMKSGMFRAGRTICAKLAAAGFETFFVGGSVRDMILFPEKIPGDIDIATNASPEAVRKVFPGASYVGKAFGVSLVHAGGHAFEVATFRKDGEYLDRRHPSAVEPGTHFDDACRRDFTLNAVYFDPLQGKVYDFHGGLEDLRDGVLRAVGVPQARFQEDALRIVRLFRFAANLGFAVSEDTRQGADAEQSGIAALSRERILQETVKVRSGRFVAFSNGLLGTVSLPMLDGRFPEAVRRVVAVLGIPEDFHIRFPLSALFFMVWEATSARARVAEVLADWPAAKNDTDLIRLVSELCATGPQPGHLERAAVYRLLGKVRYASCADLAFVLEHVATEAPHLTLLAEAMRRVASEQPFGRWLEGILASTPLRSSAEVIALVEREGLPKRAIREWKGLEEATALYAALGLVPPVGSLLDEASVLLCVQEILREISREWS